MPVYKMSQVAQLLGVSDDTVRRWVEAGRLAAVQADGRQAIEGVELARFVQTLGSVNDSDNGPGDGQHSIRNRLQGIVIRVVRDKVMAQVEMQVGPNRIVALISREAADELQLEPGVLAYASMKSTNVSIDVPAKGH